MQQVRFPWRMVKLPNERSHPTFNPRQPQAGFAPADMFGKRTGWWMSTFRAAQGAQRLAH